MTATARFGPHVARLAEADQVLPLVRLLGGGELAEWTDVVDRQARPDVLPAVGADALLLGHDDGADRLPTSAPVGLLPTDPQWRVRPALMLMAVGIPAGVRAVPAPELWPTDPMWLGRVVLPAVGADQINRRDVLAVGWPTANRRPGVLLRRAPRGVQALSVGQAKAPLRAVLATVRPSKLTWRHVAHRAAYPAWPSDSLHLGAHRPTLARRYDGTGTTAMVARALDRIGLSFDLSHAYSRAARWRIWSDDAAKAISRTNLERQGVLL